MTKEEAIKIVKDLYDKSLFLKKDKEAVRTLIPEVEESEDERIRKEIVLFLREGKPYHCPNSAKRQEWSNWLEKQVEQKPAPVLDIEIPFGSKDSELQEASYYIPEGFHAEIKGNRVIIKRGEQKPNYCHHEVDLSGCSEEYRKAYYDGWNNCNQQHTQLDAEKKSTGCPEYCVMSNCANCPYRPVLIKKLNDWSEEDELKIGDIRDAITLDDELEESYKEKLYDFLKSLCPQNTWKPSDEQISVLSRSLKYINTISQNYCHVLGELLAQLKKLREK